MKQTLLQAPAAHDSGYGALFLNVGGSLGAILLLIVVLVKLARRFGFSAPRQGGQPLLKVRAGCSLGGRERVVVVETGEHWLVLGVTPGQITHLQTLSAPDGMPEADGESPVDFATMFERRRTSQETT